MTLLKRRKVLAAKIETTSGTAIALAGADAAHNVYDVMIQPTITKATREAQGGFGELPSVNEGYSGTASFKLDWYWDGTATEPLWADTFFPSCGLVKSTNTFKPKTAVPGSDVKTITLGCYIDGKFKSLRGASGNVSIACVTGKKVTLDFSYTGIWVPPTDETMLAPTYPTLMPMRYAASTTTWDSVALCLESITLDVGNTVTLRECATTVAGFDNAIITNRVPRVTANPEAKLVATQDRYGQMLAGTEGVLSWTIPGPTTSYVTISVPKAQIQNNQEGDRNGLVTDEIEFSCNKNGSTVDEEFSIAFTPAA